MAGLLDGKVAIITGAGGGIGRCYALLFAKEGAKVVVNDLGGSRDGAGQAKNMADEVVKEIKAAGGQAVANYASVATKEGADSIVKTALDAFGRADILVNNAGILRDKTLLKLEESNWDVVIAVHLKGTFLCTQAFVAHVKERTEAKGDKGGKIVNTSSYAGLKGNFGQTNYSAAKAGIYGMTLTWSQELAKLGIQVNCIAPMAKTRMTEDITAVPDTMQPEQVAPMALFLSSSLSDSINGRIYGVHGQQLLEYKMLMTEGVTKPGNDLWTAQEIGRHVEQIGATGPAPSASGPAAGGAAQPPSDQAIVGRSFALLPQVFVPEKASGWTANIQFDIQGGEPWTVEIAGGKCTTKSGKHGTATCVVTTDVKTYSEVVQGKQKADQAFMAGKIKATNLGDMMKFGGAFDMKKARELAQKEAASVAAPQAAAAAGPVTDAQVIARAFNLMPQVFVPEKAAGWTANIQFDIQGGAPWTVEVGNGKCTTREGKHGTATCVVTTDEKTYSAVVQGKEKAEQAFMAGRIKATNLGDMMKFGGAFDMKKARELAMQSTQAMAPVPAAAASAAPTDAQVIARAFQLMPQVFVPEKAQGWNAVIQFDLAGGTPWTVEVAGGKVTCKEGKHGTPTCVVTTDEKTYSAVVQGKEKAEQAFMAGRIKASNLGDMMKFGGAFDMKKARELAQKEMPKAAAAAPAAASAPAGGGDAKSRVAAAFEALPGAFKPADASGWKAAITFEIAGGEDWTIEVADGKASVKRGKAAAPTCVVTTKLEDYAAIISGELKAEQAFMQGKLKASNLGDMMKFGRAFDMKAVAEKVRSAAPAAAAAAPSGGGGGGKKMNREVIGKLHRADAPIFLRPEWATAYAKATHDNNPAYSDAKRAGGLLAPPMVTVRLVRDALFKAVTDEELGADMLRLVHGEQEMEWLRPIRPWDLYSIRAEVSGIEPKSTGEVVTIEQRLYCGGELAARIRGGMFIRDPGAKKDKGAEPAAPPAAPKGQPAFSVKIPIAANQSHLYAEASLDNNPIHTDSEVAKMAGFKDVICHGLNTMAFAARTIVDELCGKDPTKLKRLAVRFSKPVYPGDTLTVDGWATDAKQGRKVYAVRMVNQEGQEVIQNGLAEIQA